VGEGEARHRLSSILHNFGSNSTGVGSARRGVREGQGGGDEGEGASEREECNRRERRSASPAGDQSLLPVFRSNSIIPSPAPRVLPSSRIYSTSLSLSAVARRQSRPVFYRRRRDALLYSTLLYPVVDPCVRARVCA